MPPQKCRRVSASIAVSRGMLMLAFTGIVTGFQDIVQAADPGRLRAVITFRDGTGVAAETIDNRSIRLDTAVGAQVLDIAQIQRIVFAVADPERVTVDTVAGDRWVASLDHRQLSRRLPLEQPGIAGFTVERIVFEREHPPKLSLALSTRVLLHDGTMLNIDASRTLLTLRQELDEWPLPLAAADALSFDIDDDTMVGTAFFMADGTYLRGIVAEKELKATDRFERSLALPVSAIKAVRTARPYPRGISEDADGIRETARAWRHRESIRLRERRDSDARQTSAAPLVWSLDTLAGRIDVPSPLVLSLANDPTSSRAVLETVIGERWVGTLRSAALQEVPDSDTGIGRRFAPSTLDRIVYERTPVTPPPGWLVWRLTAGDVFLARFADHELAVQGPGRRRAVTLPSDEVTDALQHEESGEWMLVTAAGQFPLHSRNRSVDIILAVNGLRLTMPLESVESVRSTTINALPPSTAVARSRWLLQDSVLVSGGDFRIGRPSGEGMPDEVPPVAVTVSTFIMDTSPITRAQFAAFARDSGYQTEAEQSGVPLHWRNPGFPQRDDDPVVFVSWFDAAHFCNWRSQRAGLEPCYEFPRRGAPVLTYRHRNGFRLPTEAEWEYAARAGGKDILYPWGDANDLATLTVAANFRHPTDADRWPWTTPVKTYPANALGLYDMAGNVWEWCEDWYFAQAYQTVFRLQSVNPLVIADQVPGLTHRVMRGGSFQNDADLLRCASRGHGLPNQSANRVGFRTVRNAVDP